MRMIAEWGKGTLRFSILKHNLNYTLKIEDGQVEQSYKLKDSLGHMNPLEYEMKLSGNELLDMYVNNFVQMRKTLTSIHSEIQIDDDEFDLIV